MARFTDRQAEFQTFAQSHQDTIVALLDGTMLERVRFRVSFACDDFTSGTFRNWRTARVGWGLWFGPQSDPFPDWSVDRTSQSWIHWQASPWIPDVETVVNPVDGTSTPANAYRAGLYEQMIEIPVYRSADGATFELRYTDKISSLVAWESYSYSSETWLDLWAP